MIERHYDGRTVTECMACESAYSRLALPWVFSGFFPTSKDMHVWGTEEKHSYLSGMCQKWNNFAITFVCLAEPQKSWLNIEMSAKQDHLRTFTDISWECLYVLTRFSPNICVFVPVHIIFTFLQVHVVIPLTLLIRSHQHFIFYDFMLRISPVFDTNDSFVLVTCQSHQPGAINLTGHEKVCCKVALTWSALPTTINQKPTVCPQRMSFILLLIVLMSL